MAKYMTISVEARDTIEIVSLDRPDALNAVTPAMADELIDYFSGLHDRLSTRVVILRGNGRAFCAGAELDFMRLRRLDPAVRNGSSTCNSATRGSSV